MRQRLGSRRVRGTAAMVVAFVGVVLAPAAAQADPIVAGDLDFLLPIDDEGTSSNVGFGVRVGQQLEGGGAALTPELGITYATFRGPLQLHAYRGFAGFRFGV